MNKQGFFLLEILLVLSLFAFLTTMIITQTEFFNRAPARMQLNRLYFYCAYLQKAAVRDQKDYILTFNEEDNSYACEGTVHTLSQGTTFGFLPESLGPPATATKKISKAITFKNKKIAFHKNGTIDVGTIYLIHKKTDAFYALSNGVAEFSLLRQYTYDGSWHLL